MGEMVDNLDGRLGKCSVEQVRYVINNLLHLVIVKYGVFTRTLYFHSPSVRDNTVATREISRHTRKMVPITGRARSFLLF